MKAIVYTKYGSPDVLQLKEVEKPTPKEDEVLVKVHAAAANPLDWHLMRGAPFPIRGSAGLLKPKNTILGLDIAGVVEAVGSHVTQFKPGDEVFGDIFGDIFSGGFAEYLSATEEKLALKPANSSFEAAAAVPIAGLTALQALRDHGQIQPGQKVLINGASGGVGTFAVQIAKSFGASVTGVCSTRNLEMVRSIGADEVIDYTKEEFTKTCPDGGRNQQRYDLILDNVGNLSVADYRRTLKSDGKGVVIGLTTVLHMFQVILLGAWVSRRGSQKIGPMLAEANKKDLVFLADLLETGKIVPVIDRCYPLAEVPEAIRYLEEGHARGKVVITVKESIDK